MTQADLERPDIESIKGPRFSWIWVIPALVIGIAAWTVYSSYAERGVEVKIRFPQGKGIVAGKTEIRYKDVTVGLVEALHLSEDLTGVVATAVLDRELEPYLGDTTDFWIVSAQISGTTLRGLGTLLSGAYIELDWSAEATRKLRDFDGLLEPPLTPPSAAGTHFLLGTTRSDSVHVGSPIVYRGVRVGQVERRQLSEDYQRIDYQVFIDAPYDELITGNTRFFDVSGFDLSLTTEGLVMEMESLQTLAAGGVSFTWIGAGPDDTAPPEQRFAIYKNRRAAEESRFDIADDQGFFLTAAFDGGVEGLDADAPVVWDGVQIGKVTEITLELVDANGEGAQVVSFVLQPSRVGLEIDDREDVWNDIEGWVRDGVRLELQTANFLTGKKRLALVERPEFTPANIDFSAQPYPRMPTNSSQLSAITEDVSELTATLAELPLEELITSATRLLSNGADLLGDQNTQAAPEALVSALESIDVLSASLEEAAQKGERTLEGLSPHSPLYTELTRTLGELNNAARAIAALSELLEERPDAVIKGRR